MLKDSSQSAPVPIPQSAVLLDRLEEAGNIFTITLRFTDDSLQRSFSYHPGQFNMVYLPGAGEVAISIMSDPDDTKEFAHTIRAVGRVSTGLQQLKAGDTVGVRGPFGQGWPMQEARGKNVVIISGGLGCAPTVSVIYYILERRQEFKKLTIIQGLKHAQDMLWQHKYDEWSNMDSVEVLLAADVGGGGWPWHVGRVTGLFSQLHNDPQDSIVMMCGPEGMMTSSAQELIDKGYDKRRIYVSLERNMQCGIGHCGHCQLGPYFLCQDGPVFSYAVVEPYIGIRGV